MKKRLFSILLSICMMAALLNGCDDEEYEENVEASETFGDEDDNQAAAATDHSGSSGEHIGDLVYNQEYYEEDEEEDDDDDDNYGWSWEDFKQAIGYDYISGGADYTEVANSNADKHVDADNFTLMIYICGSNLESEAGCATRNINQMLYSDAGDNLKIVLETGGASEWQNDVISSKKLQRYIVEKGSINHIEDAGKGSICDVDELADFIKFTAKNYPADRYGFIFWDHGGGTISGFGGDELYDGQIMTNEEIAEGFRRAGVHFDFIGYDCCLMSTIEIANSLSEYSDYLIASEETEPGAGWYYTNFLDLIENDPGVSIKDIGKQIIDDFNSEEYMDADEETTLSLVDLSQIPSVVDALNNYMASASTYLKNNGYEKVARARSSARSYGENYFEQIDIIDYLDKFGEIEGGNELKTAVANAVLYNGTRIPNSNGLAMYFPYLQPEEYGVYKERTQNLGLSDELYDKFFEDFVSLMAGNQAGGNNPYGSDSEEYSLEDIQSAAWYDAQLVEEYENYYSQVDSSTLEIVDKDGVYVLQLSDDDWELVDKIELQVYLNDDEGYLNLGSDDAYEFDDDGDLIVDYDFYWLYINECLAPYQAVRNGKTENGSEYSLGYSQAVLNDEELIKIWVKWVGDSCKVLGYTPYDSPVGLKGYRQFGDGDVIEFVFDYYTNDGEYEDSYTLEDNYFVYSTSDGVEVYYDELLVEGDVEVNFYLTDIYHNEYWTEPLLYTEE